MSDNMKYESGSIIWQDLTVSDSEKIRDFYCKVVGWKYSLHDMDNYNDFNMELNESGKTITGICHKRGENSNLPSQWLLYVYVDNVDKSIEECVKLGGKVVDGPRHMGNMRFCVIEDPSGAVIALMSE